MIDPATGLVPAARWRLRRRVGSLFDSGSSSGGLIWPPYSSDEKAERDEQAERQGDGSKTVRRESDCGVNVLLCS